MNETQSLRTDGTPRYGFGQIPYIVMEALNPFEGWLLLHYVRVIGANGDGCYESVKTTAKKTKMSDKSVTKARESLKEKGFISYPREGDSRHTFNIMVNWNLIWEAHQDWWHDLRKGQAKEPASYIYDAASYIYERSDIALKEDRTKELLVGKNSDEFCDEMDAPIEDGDQEEDSSFGEGNIVPLPEEEVPLTADALRRADLLKNLNKAKISSGNSVALDKNSNRIVVDELEKQDVVHVIKGALLSKLHKKTGLKTIKPEDYKSLMVRVELKGARSADSLADLFRMYPAQVRKYIETVMIEGMERKKGVAYTLPMAINRLLAYDIGHYGLIDWLRDNYKIEVQVLTAEKEARQETSLKTLYPREQTSLIPADADLSFLDD